MGPNQFQSVRSSVRGLVAARGARRLAFSPAASILVALCTAWAVRPAAGDVVKLAKPVHVELVKNDHTHLTGQVTLYDEEEFELVDDKGTTHDLKWSDLPASQAYDLYAALMPGGTAAQWLSAGKVLLQLPEGKAPAERAFARALRLDPGLKASVEQARGHAGSPSDAPANRGKPNTAGKPAARDDNDLLGPLTGTPAGPVHVGATQKQAWGRLTDAEQADAVKKLKAFAEGTTKGKDQSLKLIETRYFLFYSDLKPDEARNWAGLLDRMYDRLAELFAVERGRNLWKGKGLIFVFANREDYFAFEHDNHGNDAHGSAGMSTCFGDGRVHIAFYRQPQELDFAHVLVHEATHGFLHRYRSPAHVPSWANEGLAEVIASELVPQPARQSASQSSARSSLGRRGVGDDFFTVAHIAGWQYPVAENLSAFMIARNKQAYVKFINGLKDGMTVEESLEKQYGAPQQRLLPAYLEAMGVKQKGK